MREYPKRIKRLIGDWMKEAYERELHRELGKLEESMAAWRRGDISSGEMSHRIHEWETGPSRVLFKQYNKGPKDMSLAYAIVVGILDEEEVPVELLEAISGAVELFRSMQEQDELRGREGRWWAE